MINRHSFDTQCLTVTAIAYPFIQVPNKVMPAQIIILRMRPHCLKQKNEVNRSEALCLFQQKGFKVAELLTEWHGEFFAFHKIGQFFNRS